MKGQMEEDGIERGGKADRAILDSGIETVFSLWNCGNSGPYPENRNPVKSLSLIFEEAFFS